MRVAFAAAAAAAVFVCAPAHAVTAYLAPASGGYLVYSSGTVSICPTASGTPLGYSCVYSYGQSRRFTLFDGFPIDVGTLSGVVNYTVGGGSHDDSFTYSGTLTFGNGGTLLSNILTITESGDDRGRPIITSFIQQGLFYAVPIRLADGTLLVPPPPVPEPATWAMMVAGFGALGIAMRRRRPALRTA